MYEELTQRLRETSMDFGEADHISVMLLEAASAIEKLSSAGSIYGKAWTLGYDAGRDENMPHWIPVKEQLPEEPYGCLAIVLDNNVMTGDTFLNYYPEYIGFDGESWNDCDGEEIPLEVVYWMKMPKIPEPPKEET